MRIRRIIVKHDLDIDKNRIEDFWRVTRVYKTSNKGHSEDFKNKVLKGVSKRWSETKDAEKLYLQDIDHLLLLDIDFENMPGLKKVDLYIEGCELYNSERDDVAHSNEHLKKMCEKHRETYNNFSSNDE